MCALGVFEMLFCTYSMCVRGRGVVVDFLEFGNFANNNNNNEKLQ